MSKRDEPNAQACHSTEIDAAYCADCDERGIETRMASDTDFGGHLCPVCEPIDVKMIGRPEDRLARYDRLRTPAQAEAIRQVGRAIREVATRVASPADEDEHFPWSYTEYGVLCACGEPMNAAEQCPAETRVLPPAVTNG